ncbi:MAG: type II secretion system protein GspG [Planctomycetota bacterium]
MNELLKSIAGLAGFTLVAGAAVLGFANEPPEPGPAVRLLEADDGSEVSLQTPARVLSKDGVRVTLVGVTHIGDRGYYNDLEDLLDTHDLVLYERVEPSWGQDRPDAPDAWKVGATSGRLRHTATRLLLAQQRSRGRLLTDLDEVNDRIGKVDPLDRAAMTDAWGNEFVIVSQDDRLIDVISYGADGVEGGTGVNADLALSDQPEISEQEIDPSAGIQGDLAKAAGLKFQLDEINYDKPSYINADVTAERLMSNLAGRGDNENAVGAMLNQNNGGQSAAIIDLLSGDSALAKIVGGVLRFAGMLPGGRQTIRIVLIETLSRADDLLAGGGALGEDVDRMMSVLLDLRNEVVLEKLDEAIAREDSPKTIAVFFGAGHLPGIETAMLASGWTEEKTDWLTAMSVSESRFFPKEQIQSLRSLIGQSLEQQAELLNGR